MSRSLSALSDAELLELAIHVADIVGAAPDAYGSTLADVTAFLALNTTFNTDITQQIAAINGARAATVTKDASRVPVVDTIRKFRDLSKVAGATEAQITALGLPAGGALAPVTATIPIGTIDTSARLRHTIGWADSATPDNKRRPRGAIGVEIWRKLEGPPPTDQSQCTFVAIDSATPHTVEYPGEDGGKMAHYMLRWHMRDGSNSAWGETVSATITG